MAVDAGKVLAVLELDTSAFSGGLNTAKGLLKTWGDEAASGRDKLNALGKAAQGLGQTLQTAVTLPLMAVGAASTKVFTGFDDSMRQVRATMGLYDETNEQTAAAIDKLTDAAKDMGATTRYSASEAASALNYLALAGYDADQAVEALPVVLRLAQAGGIDLASASDMVTDSMSALNIEMSRLPEFVDQLAVTSQKSNTSVGQLGQAILTVGATAANLRGGTAELNAELGILADAGIKSAEGGTHLRNVILALTQPTEAGARALKKYTDGVYDAEGNMRSLDEILGELQRSLNGLSTQAERDSVINDIFNKTDLAAAQVLIAGAGERFAELTGYISNATGAAENMAEVMEGGIGGSFRSLKSAVEGAGIAIGEELAPHVQRAADFVTGLVRGFSELDQGTRQTIVTIGTIAAAVGPTLIVIGKLTTALAAINPAVLGVTAAVAGMAAVIYRLNNMPNWSKTLDGKLGLTVDESELENYKVPTEFTPEDNEVVANVQVRIHNSAESAYDQIIAIMNDGLPEGETEYKTMSDAVNKIIDETYKNIQAYWNGKKADLKKMFDEGLLSEDEYNKQKQAYETKQSEMEGQLTQNAEAVTSYIATLIAANRPMTEAEIAYLQELIDKLVEVADQAAASEEAVMGAYRLSYERVQMGVPVEGDVKNASTYIEMEAAKRRKEAEAAAQAEIDALTRQADTYTANASQYGNNPDAQNFWLSRVQGAADQIRQEQAALDQTLQEIETSRQEAYQSLVPEEQAAQLDDLIAKYMFFSDLLHTQQGDNLTGSDGLSWFMFGRDDGAIEQTRASLEELGETIAGMDLGRIREILAFMQANGEGEGWTLDTTEGLIGAMADLLGADWKNRPVASFYEDNAEATNAQAEAQERLNEAVKAYNDVDIDTDQAPVGGADREKQMQAEADAAAALAEKLAALEELRDKNKTEERIFNLNARDMGDAADEAFGAVEDSAQTAVDDIIVMVGAVPMSITQVQAYAAAGDANAAAYVSAWNAGLSGLQMPDVYVSSPSGGGYGSGGSSGGGGGSTTNNTSNYHQTINTSNVRANNIAQSLNKYTTGVTTGKGLKP